MMNGEVSLGVATEVVVLTIVVAMILLCVGLVVLIIVHVYIARGVLRGRISSSGSGNSVVEEISTIGRMSRYDVEKLTSFDYTKASPLAVDDECAVCLDSYNVGDKCRLLPFCNHKFHAHCVDLWLLSTPTCPLCRTTTTSTTAATSDFTNSGGSLSSGQGAESQQFGANVIELSRPTSVDLA